MNEWQKSFEVWCIFKSHFRIHRKQFRINIWKEVQIRSNETTVWPVYEVKWVLFKMIFCHLKMLARPWPPQCSIPRVRAFRWGTLWHFTSWSIKTNKSLSLKITKSLLLLSKVESLKLKVVAVLKPLEIKRHTVPHLKALTRGIDHWGGHGRGSTFK